MLWAFLLLGMESLKTIGGRVGKITKQRLARTLAKELGITKDLAHQCVDALFQAMIESIIQGNRIEVRGFGSWSVQETNPRPNARNPMTGERVSVPARRKVRFKAGKRLKNEFFHSKETDGDASG